MPGFGSNSSALTYAKGSRWDDQAERAQQRATLDRLEHAKVKARSGGRCEVVIAGVRCKLRAVHDHHRLGGSGRRNAGDSVLASQRLHTCAFCHMAIHQKQLRPASWKETNWAVTVQWTRE